MVKVAVVEVTMVKVTMVEVTMVKVTMFEVTMVIGWIRVVFTGYEWLWGGYDWLRVVMSIYE